MTAGRPATHGHTRGGPTRTYRAWLDMKNRCLNPNVKAYPRYGGRGIAVCLRWMEFEHFLVDMGEAPRGLTLDRKDNDGDYAPGNCRWATYREQNNNRSDNRLISHNGTTQSIRMWERELGLSVGAIRNRMKRGWPIERVLTPASVVRLSAVEVEQIKGRRAAGESCAALGREFDRHTTTILRVLHRESPQ